MVVHCLLSHASRVSLYGCRTHWGSTLRPLMLPFVVAATQRIAYAKTKSDAVAKVDGTFKPDTTKERAKRNAAARGASSTLSCKTACLAHARERHLDVKVPSTATRADCGV